MIIGFVIGTLPIVWYWNQVGKAGNNLLLIENLNFVDMYTFLIILIVLFLMIFTDKYAKNKRFGLIGRDIDYSFSKDFFQQSSKGKFRKL